MHSTLLSICLLTFLYSVNAQFQFFDNFFGQQHQQHQEARAPPRGSDWYAEQVLETHCDSGNYLCPETLDCVSKPVDCPCALDLVRCVIGNKRICVSRSEGQMDCALVDQYNKVRHGQIS